MYLINGLLGIKEIIVDVQLQSIPQPSTNGKHHLDLTIKEDSAPIDIQVNIVTHIFFDSFWRD